MKHMQQKLFESITSLRETISLMEDVEIGIEGGTEVPKWPTTDAEIRAFQRSHKQLDGHPLVVDGLVGRETTQALAKAGATPPANFRIVGDKHPVTQPHANTTQTHANTTQAQTQANTTPVQPSAYDTNVALAQEELVKKGYPLRVTGIMDEMTQRALIYDLLSQSRDAKIQGYDKAMQNMNPDGPVVPYRPVDQITEDSLARIVELSKR